MSGALQYNYKLGAPHGVQMQQRRREIQTLIVTVSVVAFSLSSCGLFSPCRDSCLTSKVFGIGVPLGPPLLSATSGSSWNGDGADIWVYTAPSAIVARFADSAAAIEGFPLNSDRNGWQCMRWRPAPIDSLGARAAEFALMSGTDSVKAAFRGAMAAPGNWVAYCVKITRDFILDAEVFVIDTRQRMFLWADEFT
jgi:hypothetical protein